MADQLQGNKTHINQGEKANNAFRSIEWIAEDKYRIWLHVLFWLFVYLDKILALLGLGEIPYISIYTVPYYFLLDAGMVYFILYVLVPAFLLNNQIYKFVGLTFVTLFINVEISYLLTMHVFCIDCDIIYESGVALVLVNDFANSAFIFGSAIGANILRRFIKSQIRIRQLELDNLESELNFLKAQINPHFLFNSLNNIYVQARKKRPEAAESILQLSDLLRYQLYDCSNESVPLTGEIEYLKNYLKLDKLRKSSTDMNLTVEGNPDGINIAPYIFIPFVENAVKHGTISEEEGFINIEIKVLDSNQLDFSVVNSKPKSMQDKKTGGIGLVNVKRRLQLLYPDRYELNISETEHQYEVNLRIDLNEQTEIFG